MAWSEFLWFTDMLDLTLVGEFEDGEDVGDDPRAGECVPAGRN